MHAWIFFHYLADSSSSFDSGIDFDGDTVGLANKFAMCEYGSGGVNQVFVIYLYTHICTRTRLNSCIPNLLIFDLCVFFIIQIIVCIRVAL